MEQVADIRHTLGTKVIYTKRRETIEMVFVNAKELHGMRYAKHRGYGWVKIALDLLFVSFYYLIVTPIKYFRNYKRLLDPAASKSCLSTI